MQAMTRGMTDVEDLDQVEKEDKEAEAMFR